MTYELDDRLINVLVHLANDKTTEEIATAVHFSARTVKTDIRRLEDMFGVRSRAGLVAKAIREGVIE